MRRSGSFDDGWPEQRTHKGGADVPIGRWSRPGRWWFVTDGTPGPIAGGVAGPDPPPPAGAHRGPPPGAYRGPPPPAARRGPARVHQMSSHRTFGGLPALPEPARTRNDDTLTHDHA